MFAWTARRKQRHVVAHRLHEAILSQSRLPGFYAHRGVPDTFDGRFELVLLHAFLVWNRLRDEGEAGQRAAQDMFDAMFRNMSAALRQIGVGDLGVPHHMKRMMKAFKGRAMAYQAGLNDPQAMREALRRNLFGTITAPESIRMDWFTGYMGEAAKALTRQDGRAVLDGHVDFSSLDPDKEEADHDRARMVA
jgi:cytochrome b pre-mRNA-processing protein 3